MSIRDRTSVGQLGAAGAVPRQIRIGRLHAFAVTGCDRCHLYSLINPSRLSSVRRSVVAVVLVLVCVRVPSLQK